MPPGFALIISAPSGTGKSTVCRKLLARDKSLRGSLSCTTRVPRPNEKNGRDYYFLSVEDFKKKIHRDEFLEWAIVHDQYYGTPREFMDNNVAAGHVVVLAIDVQGASAIRRKRPHAVTVFLVPPSWRSLEQRLSQRKNDSRESMERRLLQAPLELSRAKHYDYLVVNDDLEEAVRQIESIITAERLKTFRQDLSALGIASHVPANHRRS